ncbi:hypothetical protein GCM10009848_05280 [Micromonospora lupini]
MCGTLRGAEVIPVGNPTQEVHLALVKPVPALHQTTVPGGDSQRNDMYQGRQDVWSSAYELARVPRA